LTSAVYGVFLTEINRCAEDRNYWKDLACLHSNNDNNKNKMMMMIIKDEPEMEEKVQRRSFGLSASNDTHLDVNCHKKHSEVMILTSSLYSQQHQTRLCTVKRPFCGSSTAFSAF